MPNIFGAGLLDILNHGGQFIAGRQAGQRDRAAAEAEAAQKAALQQALMEQYKAQAASARALADQRLNPAPEPLNLQQTIGAVASMPDADPDAIVAAYPNADPLLVRNVLQQRADQTASQQRQQEAADRAVQSQDRATATAERVTANQERSQLEDSARGYARVYAQQALAQPGNDAALRNAAVAAITATGVDRGVAVDMVNSTFDELRRGGQLEDRRMQFLEDGPATAATPPTQAPDPLGIR